MGVVRAMRAKFCTIRKAGDEMRMPGSSLRGLKVDGGDRFAD